MLDNVAKMRSMLPVPLSLVKIFGANRGAGRCCVGLIALCLAMGGCSKLRPKPATQYVYVTAKQTFLRDRVAAVSNRMGTVNNGQRLEVLERGRRFYRVKTEKNEVGWIDEKAVATQQVFDEFGGLYTAHTSDATVASAVTRDEVNLHLTPGRATESFYRLAEGEKLQLLERATLPKPAPGAVVVKARARVSSTAGASALPAPADTTAVPTPMEDWWLVRDGKGRAGWLLSRMLEVDAPDTLTRYAEGQKFIGAYVLTTVHDEGAEGDNKDVPIYLTVLGSYAAGLPYDFDQVRVFTWSVKMHRYETAFREKNIEGYLPVTIRTEKDPYGKAMIAQTPLPTFTYKVLAEEAGPVIPDPATGLMTPGKTIAKTYRLEGNLVRRVQPPGSKDEPEAHPAAVEKKDKKGKKK